MNEHLSENQFTSYVYSTLTDAQRETMDVHIGTCQTCRARLGEHQALHRRARYSIMDRRREGGKFSQANFAEIIPRLRRSRRVTKFWIGTRQFVYGVTTLLVLVILGIGLALFLRGIHLPIPTQQPPAPGTYVKTITLEETSADDQFKGIPDRNTLPGDWQLTLAEGGHYTFIIVRDEKLPIVAEEGRYTLTPDRIVFEVNEASSCLGAGQGVGDHELTLHGDGFCYVCGAPVYSPLVGAYRWALIGNTLTMTATELEDPCHGRRFVSTAHGWSKVVYVLPVGVYTIAIADGEVPVGVTVDLQAALPGQWELSLAQGQRFSLTHDGTSVSQGHYHLTRELMILTAEQGECTSYGEEGAYQWAFDGQTLSLTAVQDWCDKRNAVFTLRPLTRSEEPRVMAEPEAAATLASSITLEGLAGLWQDAETDTYLQFGTDGAFHLADSPAWLEVSPLDVGQFRLEGDLLTLSSSNDSLWCVHQQGRYQVELTQPDELRFELQEDPCQSRASKLPVGRWGRVEP